MALWTGLGQAATVVQLVGANVGSLISMIVQAAMTARQNKSECEQLARRVLMIAQLLPLVQEPEAAQPLSGLGDTLRDAHELVVSCQGRSTAYQFVMASRTAEKFREVQSKIDSYLILFPVITHIGITRRLERIYNVLVTDDSRVEPSPLPELKESTDVVQELLPQGTKKFTFAEIVAATNNFALDTVISRGGFGTVVYRGRLHDGREVAIKRINNTKHSVEEFCMELGMLSRLRHKHIIRLLGSCVRNEKRLLTMRIKEMQRLFVYEYMENGTLSDHLHRDVGASTSSPVTVSWKMRIEVLLGVSRAIEHLHCHANPPIIHRDIKSSNILLDANWVPRLSDFGLSVAFHMESEELMSTNEVIGTLGYLDPEYLHTGILKPTSDVYSLGVLMLVVLTGKKAYSRGDEDPGMIGGLASFTLPVIEAGNFEELLDRRPVPEPTPGQLKALELVAQTAGCCVKLNGKDRPAMSDIVGNLERAHELICRDKPGSAPHASSVPSTGSQSQLECEVLEEGFDTNL